MRRRSYLAAVSGALVSVAGCAGRSADSPAPGADTSAADPDGDADSDPDTDGTDTPAAGPVDGNDVAYRVETVATGFDQPWAIAHLPDGATLVTELGGRLRLLDRTTGAVETVSGVPAVYARGQGGLLDVTAHPDSSTPDWIYLTYAVARAEGRSTTRLARARLDRADARLTDLEVLFTAEPAVESDGHFGSRVIVDPAGELYMTVGDRQFKNFGPDHVAQDLSNHLGTTLRLHADGTVPEDNPFVDRPDARDAIYSYGHRNAQGLTVHPETGAVWESEFGERDGDEINVIQAGANYGWPVADESCKYGTDEPVGASHADREAVTAPVYSWPCGTGGFPPSGTTFYDGEAFPAWQGDLFVGGLASRYLARFRVDGETVIEAAPLLADRGWRIRAVAAAPDTGHLYVAVDDGAAPIVRLVPA